MIKYTVALLAVATAAAQFADFNGTVEASCKLGTATGCSTNVAEGLTYQIKDELNKMGYSFVALNSQWVKCSSPCINALQSVSATALVNAAKSKNDYITCKCLFDFS